MKAATTSLHGALLVDFTGQLKGFKHLKAFGEEFIAMVRNGEAPRALVIVDRAVAMPLAIPVVVRDHVNLTGSSPLLGPNHPLGERFPVVQGIYVTDELPAVPQAVVAGLNEGQQLSADDLSFLQSLDVGACCYNLPLAMLIAAHARCRVLGIVVPASGELPSDLLTQIQQLTGGN